MVDPAIRTENLSKRFGPRLAVDAVNIEVGRGEVFGFLGPNGAGKTTTIAMLLGLVRPTSGRAFVLGHDVAREAAAALRGVGAMIEAPAFYPYLSGGDNLRVLARIHGLPEAAVQRALAAVELSDRARDRYRAYSQGMRQRLGIAAALLHQPQLVMLDEPTNGLDPAGTVELRALIRSLADDGRTVFLSSHLLHEVQQVCDRVAILKAGRVLRQGAVRDLLRQGQGLQLRVEGDAAPALALLRELPWVGGVERHGDALLVDAPAERAAELNALLARGGVPVAELRAREGNLEELFLELTSQ
jgi:ABC-2 type transport system ATP-binding protein